METDPTGTLARERAWNTQYDLMSFRQGWDQCALHAFRDNSKLRDQLEKYRKHNVDNLAIAYLQDCCRDVGCGPERREELEKRIEKIKAARAALEGH